MFQTTYSQEKVTDIKNMFTEATTYFRMNEFSKSLEILFVLDTVPKYDYYSVFVDDRFIIGSDTVSKKKIWIKYYIGMCYSGIRRHETKSIPYFEYCIESKYSEIPSIIYNKLAIAYQQNYQFDKAIAFTKKFMEHNRLNSTIDFDSKRMIQICENAKSMVALPLKHKIQNAGLTINTTNSEYKPIISEDDKTLYFQQTIFFETGGQMLTYEVIMVSHKAFGIWMHPQIIHFDLLEDDAKISLVGLSNKEKQLFVRITSDKSDDIYLCILENNVCVELQSLNTKIGQYNPISVSMNGIEKEIYFSAELNGGFGGLDIYKIEKQNFLTWGEPMNLGAEINTQYNEDAPYLNKKTKTLYFSSTGHNTIGGYDFFKAKMDENETIVENLGFPINTTFDDKYFSLCGSGQKGYFSCSQFYNKYSNDIYTVDYRQIFPFAIVRGEIFAGNPPMPVNAKIMAFDKKTKKQMKFAHNPRSVTGKYFMIFPSGRDYSLVIEVEGYLPQLVNIYLPQNADFNHLFQKIYFKPNNLLGDKLSESITIKNSFFDIGTQHKDTSLVSKLYIPINDEKDSLIQIYQTIVRELAYSDSLPTRDLETEMPTSDSLSNEDLGQLLRFIENAIEDSDSISLQEIDRVTNYVEIYSQDYYYTNGSAQMNLYQIVDQDTIYTLLPVDASRDDYKSAVFESQEIEESDTQILYVGEGVEEHQNKVEDEEIIDKQYIFTYQLYFETNEYELDAKYYDDMNEIAKLLINYPNLKFEFICYGIPIDKDDVLFEDRTKSILDFLAKGEGPGYNIIYKSCMESKFADSTEIKAIKESNISIPDEEMENRIDIKIYDPKDNQ